MKLITGLLLAAALGLAACAHNITPAEGELLGCDAFASALDVLTPLRAEGKLNDATVAVVDKAVAAVEPVCLGQAPDINATVKSTLVDSGAKVLQSVAASVLGG